MTQHRFLYRLALAGTIVSVVASAAAQNDGRIHEYMKRGTVEFVQLSNQPYRAGEYKQYKTIRKGERSFLKVRFNALSLLLTVKSKDIFITLGVPTALSSAGVIPTEALNENERKILKKEIESLLKVIEVGQEALASAKADSPPLTVEDAQDLSDVYLAMFKRAGLEGEPTSMSDAKHKVDQITGEVAGTVVPARERILGQIAAAQTAIDEAQKVVDDATEQSVKAGEVVTDRTLSVTEATDRITLATRLAQEAKDALVAAKADLAEAEEAEKKAPAGAKGAAAQRVYAANKAVTAALTQKTLRDAEHQAAIESRDTAEKNLAAATRAKLNADTDLAVKRRVLQRAQDLQNPIRTSLNNFDTSVEDLEGLITQAKESAGFIYNCMELAHLATTLEMDATGDELKVELAFAPRPPDVTIVNGETTANGPPGTRTGAPAGLPTVESGPIMAPGTRTFPVDFGLFRSMSPSYSVGLVRSALRDDNPRSIDNGDGTFTIFPGVRSEPTVKPIALLHLNIYKSGGLYTGPALGVIGSNYWAGWGVQLGRVNDRLSLNLGYEFGTVKRLNGVSYGTGQIPGSSLTTDVKRSSPALSITYSFKIPTGT